MVLARPAEEAPAALEKKRACVTINVGCSDEGMSDWEEGKAEKECRICHLSWETRELLLQQQQQTELIQLGCGCKGDLAFAHRPCAEAWFKIKGNRLLKL